LVSLLEDNAIIQINPNGIRHIRKDKRINQWLTDGKILKAACNPRQLAIAVMGGEIIYFELDNMGNLAEIEKMTVEGEVTINLNKYLMIIAINLKKIN
jgi:splicing factor 3B subunit 3